METINLHDILNTHLAYTKIDIEFNCNCHLKKKKKHIQNISKLTVTIIMYKIGKKNML